MTAYISLAGTPAGRRAYREEYNRAYREEYNFLEAVVSLRVRRDRTPRHKLTTISVSGWLIRHQSEQFCGNLLNFERNIVRLSNYIDARNVREMLPTNSISSD